VPEVRVSAGSIEYEDTGGDGPPIVLIHGLMMNGAQWRHVVKELRPDYRCVLPTLPMGAHRKPVNADADLSLHGLGRIIAEFLEQLELDEVTLCFNEWCGAQVMIADGLCDRVGRLVLASCEAFDNYPPGLPGNVAWLSAKLPGGLSTLRESPLSLGRMTKRGIPDELVEQWVEPLKNPEIRRDLRKYAGQARSVGRPALIAATDALPSFDRPVLVVWAKDDRVMPPEHGRRLADAFPHGRLVEIDDSYTLIPKTSLTSSPGRSGNSLERPSRPSRRPDLRRRVGDGSSHQRPGRQRGRGRSGPLRHRLHRRGFRASRRDAALEHRALLRGSARGDRAHPGSVRRHGGSVRRVACRLCRGRRSARSGAVRRRGPCGGP
jgi:pimeloyl-ACP methyl ester carboxylesterase